MSNKQTTTVQEDVGKWAKRELPSASFVTYVKQKYGVDCVGGLIAPQKSMDLVAALAKQGAVK